MWASSALHLNDATESRYAIDVLRAELKRRLDSVTESAALSRHWKDFYEEWEGKTGSPVLADGNTPVYVLSFSANGNQLSQWRAYCRHGAGFSMGFAFSDLAYALATSEFLLVRCVYQPREQAALVSAGIDYMQRAWRRADGFLGLKGLSFVLRTGMKFMAVMQAIKHESFKEEEEWRLVGYESPNAPRRFRVGRFGVVPYCAVPLCPPEQKPTVGRVYIGPSEDPAVARIAVSDLLWAHAARVQGQDDRVVESGIPYRG